MDRDKARIFNENHMENCNVIMGDVYEATFALPGAQVTINQLCGKGQKPGQEVKGGPVEDAEAREKRKKDVMRQLTSAFQFSDSQLGKDTNGKRVTNERLASLFRRCFGVCGHPTQENRQIMEQMWVLLIDKRERCAKTAGEAFFRQTVLNVVGYFKQCGLLSGTKLDLARAIFEDADQNMAKNIERNITPKIFPEGLVDMLDEYIDNADQW